MFKRTSASSKAGATAGAWSSTASPNIVASLVGAALLAALVVVLSFWAFRQIEDSVAARLQTYTLISNANALLSDITDAETGQRGYSLTGNEAFLKPYLAVRKTIEPNLQELRRLATLAELSAVVELRRNRKMTSGLAAAGGSSQGLGLMESIRAETTGYIRLE